MTDAEIKMNKVKMLVEAEERLRETMKTEKTYANSVALQSLQRQRREIMGTLPGIRLVHG